MEGDFWPLTSRHLRALVWSSEGVKLLARLEEVVVMEWMGDWMTNLNRRTLVIRIEVINPSPFAFFIVVLTRGNRVQIGTKGWVGIVFDTLPRTPVCHLE